MKPGLCLPLVTIPMATTNLARMFLNQGVLQCALFGLAVFEVKCHGKRIPTYLNPKLSHPDLQTYSVWREIAIHSYLLSILPLVLLDVHTYIIFRAVLRTARI